DDEGDVFVQPGVVAENLHAQFALADAFQAAAERRSYQYVQQDQAGGEESKDQKEERNLVGQVQSERGPVGDVDAVVATGQRIPAIGQAPDALSERQCDHQEID